MRKKRKNKPYYNFTKHFDPTDIVGDKFGKLTVTDYIGYDEYYSEYFHQNRKKYKYKCECECGNKNFIVYRSSLLRHDRTHCDNREHYIRIDINELIGKRFGKLTVVKFLYHNYDNNMHYYLCKCDCGNTITVTRSNLIGNTTLSCGCYKRQRIIESHTKHNMTYTRFWNIWHGMKNRCSNKKMLNYKDYGGRGIKVCDRWLESFENFRDDMYDEYVEKSNLYGEQNISIDRIDVDGNYEPSNCRWSTNQEQSYNKTNNHMVNFGDKTYALKQALEVLGNPEVCYSTVQSRVDRGIDPLIAISNPVFSKYSTKHGDSPIEFFDENNPPGEYISAKKMLAAGIKFKFPT